MANSILRSVLPQSLLMILPDLAVQHEAVYKAYRDDTLSIQMLGEDHDLMVEGYYRALLNDDAPKSLVVNEISQYLVATVSPHEVKKTDCGGLCWAYLLPDFWTLIELVRASGTDQHDEMIKNISRYVYHKTKREMIACLSPELELEYERFDIWIAHTLKQLQPSH